jgi:hypothetical protein
MMWLTWRRRSSIHTAIEAARREIFGIVPGNGLRSGRKILRSNLKGPMISGYYPPTMTDMPLEAIGIQNEAREALFLKEEMLNRVGKTRIKGKMRGGTAEFQDYMRFREITVRALLPARALSAHHAFPRCLLLFRSLQRLSPLTSSIQPLGCLTNTCWKRCTRARHRRRCVRL